MTREEFAAYWKQYIPEDQVPQFEHDVWMLLHTAPREEQRQPSD